MTAVITIASGTAKVGKTVLSANLAHYLNATGSRSALLVAGSADPVLGVQPKNTWADIKSGRMPIGRAIESTIFGVDVAVTREQRLDGFSTRHAQRLAESIRGMESYAYLLVDMAAGLTAPAVACCLAATESILVITADTPALTAAYEWLARLVQYGFKGPINMVLNQVSKPALAQSVFIRFRDLAQKRLNIQVNLWGSLSFDEDAQGPGALDRPLSIWRPHSKLLREIQIIGDRLIAEHPPENQTQTFNTFWQMFVDKHQSLPVLQEKPHARRHTAQAMIDKTVAHQERDAHPEGAIRHPTDMTTAFHEATDQLSAIAAELHAIRRLMEIGADRKNNIDPAGLRPPDTQTTLDFDAYVSRREKAR
jgi:MinD-like ATPase involved in chromosome partitioning or flagellar assembly